MNTTDIIDPVPNKEPLPEPGTHVRRKEGSRENFGFVVVCRPVKEKKKRDTKSKCRSIREEEEGEEEEEVEKEEEEEEEEDEDWEEEAEGWKKKKEQKRSCRYDRRVATSSHGSQRDLGCDLSSVFVETKGTRRGRRGRRTRRRSIENRGERRERRFVGCNEQCAGISWIERGTESSSVNVERFEPCSANRGISVTCVRLRTDQNRSISPKSKGVSTRDKPRTRTTFFRKLRRCPLCCIEAIKRIYHEVRPRRVIGFRCDIRKCPSTLYECSTSPCKEDIMTFEISEEGKMNPSIRSPFEDEVETSRRE